MVHSAQKIPFNDTYSRRPKNPAQMEFMQDLQGLWGKRTASVLSARAEFVVQGDKVQKISSLVFLYVQRSIFS